MSDSKSRNDFAPIKGARSFHNCRVQTRHVIKQDDKTEVEVFRLRPGKTAHDKYTGAWKSKEQQRAAHAARRNELKK